VGESVDVVVGAVFVGFERAIDGVLAALILRHILTVTRLTVTLNERYSFPVHTACDLHPDVASRPQHFRISATL